jgi:hypothetical protein
VNTNALAKHYTLLTPAERLPLILAASARGDEQEASRLATSAPRVGYQFQDYFGLAQAFREVSDMHFMELLALAANYFQCQCLSSLEGKQGERMLDAALIFGYLFKVNREGWRLFCAGRRLEPELLWSCQPGYDTVERAAQMAERAAFTAEGVVRHLERGSGKPARAVTAEEVAGTLEEVMKARAEWWG